MKIKFILILSLMMLTAGYSRAQKVSLSTNLLEWANFGTVNLDAGVSVHKSVSVHLGAKYNPWEFKTNKLQLDLYNKQTTGYLDVRYWPSSVFSGWWFGARARVSDYSTTGVWRHALEEGFAVGVGLSFGYSLTVHERLRLDFGAGFWGGRKLEYDLYCCTDCMKFRESGPRNFITYDDVKISLVYLF